MKTKKYFYRYAILISCFILMAVPASLINSIHTLFITPVTQSKGFSISGFSLIFTISAIVVAVASPVVGKILNVMRLRNVMTGSAFLVGLGFMTYSLADTLSIFYVIAVIIALGMTALTMLPVSLMIKNWFAESQGTALGIVFAGVGTGTFFWMQIVSEVLSKYGFAYTYLLLGIIILAVAVPITFFFVYKSPAEKYHLEATGEVSQSAIVTKSSFAEIIKEPGFIAFASGLFFLGFVVTGTQIHIQPYLMSLGYPLSYNADIGSTIAMAGLIGSLLGGIVFDKLPIKLALGSFTIAFLIALFLLVFADRAGVPSVFAIIFGISLCVPSLWPPYGVGKIFKSLEYGSTLGLANLFFVSGGALGPFFSGMMADSQFGYKAAWCIYFLCATIYLMLFFHCLNHDKSKHDRA